MLTDKLHSLLDSDHFDYDHLRSMFLTLCLDQFFICFIGVVSTALVSSVGEAAIAAVSMVGTINAMVSLIFTSLASGGAIVVSRAKGRGERNEIREAIGEVTGLCGFTATVLAILMILFSQGIVDFIYPEVEEILRDYAVRYMRLMAISFIPYSVFCAIFNIFRSVGDTRSALVLTMVINVAHLMLSLLFINGMHLGVDGSGLSYIIARLLGMVLALIWLLRIHNDYGVRPGHFFRFHRSITREIVSLGMPLTMESLLMQGGMLLVQIYLARLTTTDLAAHAVANSLLLLYQITAGAMNTIVGTVCGQCYGAGEDELTRRYIRNIIFVGRFVLLVSVLILYPLTPLLLQLYHASPAGSGIASSCLLIAAIAMPILWCDANLLGMGLRVAGDSMYVGTVSVLALAIGRLVIGYILTIPMGLGVQGVWISMVIEWLLRAVALRLRFRGDRWLHREAPKAA